MIDLPERAGIDSRAGHLSLYPALDDVAGRVDIVLLPPGPGATLRHGRGVRRLLLRELGQQAQMISKKLRKDNEIALLAHSLSTLDGRVDSFDALVDDVLSAAADEAFALEPPVRSRAALEACLAAGRGGYVEHAERLLDLLRLLMRAHRRIRVALADAERVPASVRADVVAQLSELVGPGCLTRTPVEWRRHLPRYLEAVEVRLDKLPARPAKDGEYQQWIERAWRRFAERRAALPSGWPLPVELERYRWMVEEFRVSLFAQALGTSVPVSAKRLDAAWARCLSA
jgi:ATP-dependent helicase HrpA